jgi:DNA-binding Lrp family transcriptional regulator
LRGAAIEGSLLGPSGPGSEASEKPGESQAKDIVDITGVQQAQAVTGPYDVIVRAEARNIDELGQLVVARVQAVAGITRTLTCPVVHLE